MSIIPLRCAGLAPRALAATVLSALVLTTAACGSSGSAAGAAAVSADPSLFPGTKTSASAPVRVAIITNEGGAAISQPETTAAAKAAVSYANDNLGGIGGHRIDIVLTCPTREEVATARTCANKVVEAKADALVVTSTGLGATIAPIVTGAGIPYITANGATAPELTSAASFVWTGGFPSILRAWAKYAKDKGYRSFTAFVIDSPSAIGAAQQLGAPAFKAAGVDFTVATVPAGTPDATPIVSAALRRKPDAVAVIGESTVCISVIKALATVGTSADRLITQPCVERSVLDAVGSAIDGTQVATPYDVISKDDPEVRRYDAIMARYAPDTPTGGYAGIGYQGMMSFIRAAQGIRGDISPAAVIAAVKSAKNVPLPIGHGITFTCDGTALPPLVSVCSSSNIFERFDAGKATDAQVVALR
ncbi:ABC transporter substrate-binding protein [Frankia sp. AiPs1]|uniref:ABC transporter substrate-binding protein n=1 Tax=Frankia sp. AiPs1 TaxID=573493 RepID=UPI002043DF21|nr:ABC transporter substrate-binding protein [Frankia sp. AiPs1]MCM3920151.1 ABC transporter substrate-binding protein [Frankia sp. AiPs1]